MPDSSGKIRGITVPSVPWHERDQHWDDTSFAESEWECTHCNGEGLCYDGSDPLGDCPDIAHRCHACNGSGKREDQRIF